MTWQGNPHLVIPLLSQAGDYEAVNLMGRRRKGIETKTFQDHMCNLVWHFSSLTSYIETYFSVATEIDLTQPDTFQASVLSKAHRQQVAEEIPPSVCQGGEGCPSPALKVHGEMSKWYLFDFIYETLNP